MPGNTASSRIILTIMFIGGQLFVFGQSWKIEHLKNQLAATSDDSIRIRLVADLSYLYTDVDLDSALQWSLKGVLLAIEKQDQTGEALCLLSLGRAYMHFGNSELALQKMMEALAMFERLNHERGRGLSMINVALVHAYLQSTDLSLEYALKAKQIADDTKDIDLLISSLLKLCDSYDSPDTVLLLATQARNLSISLKDTVHWARSLNYLSGASDDLGDTTMANKYRQQAISLYKAVGSSRGLAQSYLVTADIHALNNQFDSSLFYATQALSVSKDHHFAFIEMGVLETLSRLYEEKNDREALRYYKLYKQASDEFYDLKVMQQINNMEFERTARIREEEALKKAYRNRVVQIALSGGLLIFLISAIILYRNNKQKQRSNAELKESIDKLESTQSQLIQSEKMASLGEMTAGIAHEIQNPLNFVNNFSEINGELIGELNEEIKSGNLEEAGKIAQNIKENAEKIVFHGKRADGIVKSMLQHSRTSTGRKELVDLNALVDEYLRLAYHGLRAKDKSFNAQFITELESDLPGVEIIPQEIGRVLLNLISNALYAVSEKKKSGDPDYKPLVSVRTANVIGTVQISIKDNGNGIPEELKDKIFLPFFTTKPTGQGTGLGLSISYDIVKSHGGDIQMKSQSGIGTEFVITLPAKPAV